MFNIATYHKGIIVFSGVAKGGDKGACPPSYLENSICLRLLEASPRPTPTGALPQDPRPQTPCLVPS